MEDHLAFPSPLMPFLSRPGSLLSSPSGERFLFSATLFSLPPSFILLNSYAGIRSTLFFSPSEPILFIAFS